LDDFEGALEGEEEAAAIVVCTIAGAGSTDVFESVPPAWNGRQGGSRAARRGNGSWLDDYIAQPVFSPVRNSNWLSVYQSNCVGMMNTEDAHCFSP
jgi:hypothetical protein